jgi:hypothetical protein
MLVEKRKLTARQKHLATLCEYFLLPNIVSLPKEE